MLFFVCDGMMYKESQSAACQCGNIHFTVTLY